MVIIVHKYNQRQIVLFVSRCSSYTNPCSLCCVFFVFFTLIDLPAGRTLEENILDY